ncbi:hypothetical protein BGZ60DRAFT_222106 [Tricladium varicosporioides]|nr:hypothetical protein BGZ60DRAFT_222106 [Hymenoscyphus varicosporioides]
MKAIFFLTILPALLGIVSSHPLSGDELLNITLALDSDIETRELRARGSWSVGKHVIAGEGTTLTARGLGLSAISRTPQSIQVFYSRGSVVGGYGALTEIHWEEGKQWQLNPMTHGLGTATSIRGFITALSRRSDREEVFYPYDDEIKSHHWTGTWQYSEEVHSNKYGGGKIAALANSANEMELFYVGQDGGTIRNSYWVENKTPWTHNLLVQAWEAKAHNKEIVAVRSGNDKYVFWMMTNGEIKSWHWWPSSGWWSGPFFPDANAWGGLAVVSRKAGEVELFWIGKDKKIYHSYNTGAWKVSRLSDTLAEANIEVVSRHENHMEIFWIRPDGAIYHKYWLGGVWSEGQVPGAGPGTCNPQSEITVVSRKSDTIEGWCKSNDYDLVHFYYYD